MKHARRSDISLVSLPAYLVEVHEWCSAFLLSTLHDLSPLLGTALLPLRLMQVPGVSRPDQSREKISAHLATNLDDDTQLACVTPEATC